MNELGRVRRRRGLGPDRGGSPGRRRGPGAHLRRPGRRGTVLLSRAGVCGARRLRRPERAGDRAAGAGQAGPEGRERVRRGSHRADGPGGLDAVHGRARAVLRLPHSRRPSRSRSIPSAAGLEILVLDTCTPHALVDSEYAARRASCEQAAAILGVRRAARRDRPGCRPGPAAGSDDAAPGAPRGDRERTGRSRPPTCSAPVGWPISPRCSMPRTPRCGTTSRSPFPPSTSRWKRPARPARSAPG